MRFLCLTSQANSRLTSQVAPRDWWSVTDCESIANEGFPRNTCVVIQVSTPEERKRLQHWVARNSAGGPVFVIDESGSDRDVTDWLDCGAQDVFESSASTADLIEELARQDAGPQRLIGRSLRIEAIREKIRLVASRRCSVLLEGETGTGKEVVARSIHLESDRKSGPWITVNCAAIPEALLEAELFGHVKGAFTGAVQARIGKFEAANHGTIFLDEIGDMPLSVQSKLLRVLQEREVERLGGNERIRLDVRVIAATNARLEELVRQGRFRQDLYFRLNVVRIAIPALRERREDIELLARKFVHRTCRVESMPTKQLSLAAAERLSAHHWPGNVRELENTIESAVILSGDDRILQPEHLDVGEPVSTGNMPSPELCASEAFSGPSSRRFDLPAAGIEYQRALEDFERNLLTQALTRVRGNKTAAAELLGLKRTTLSAKLRILESRMPRLVAQNVA